MKISLSILALGCMLIACSSPSKDENKEPIIPGPEPTPGKTDVFFAPSIYAFSRATNTAFAFSDEISVFAVQINTDNQVGVLTTSSNYAENVKYIYRSDKFEPYTTAINFPDKNTMLAFHAVYPYSSMLPVPEFNFIVQKDQSTTANQCQSDLMTAFKRSEENALIPLNFYHRLSRIIINLTLEGFFSNEIQVSFTNILYTAKVDLNNTTFEGTGLKGTIIPASDGLSGYKIILPPQTLAEGMELASFVIEGDKYTWEIANELVLNPGVEYQYDLKVTTGEKGKIVELSSSIIPWEK